MYKIFIQSAKLSLLIAQKWHLLTAFFLRGASVLQQAHVLDAQHPAEHNRKSSSTTVIGVENGKNHIWYWVIYLVIIICLEVLRVWIIVLVSASNAILDIFKLKFSPQTYNLKTPEYEHFLSKNCLLCSACHN